MNDEKLQFIKDLKAYNATHKYVQQKLWPKCICGHIVQLHLSTGLCGTRDCDCGQYEPIEIYPIEKPKYAATLAEIANVKTFLTEIEEQIKTEDEFQITQALNILDGTEDLLTNLYKTFRDEFDNDISLKESLVHNLECYMPINTILDLENNNRVIELSDGLIIECSKNHLITVMSGDKILVKEAKDILLTDTVWRTIRKYKEM